MKKGKIITLVAILTITLIMIISFMTVRKVNRSVIEDHEFYQYFAGRKVEYNGTITLERISNKVTQIVIEENKVKLDSTPIYYNDVKNKVIFPQNMAVVYPVSNGLMYKINRFSNLKKESESTYIETEQTEKVLENVFLFDGGDLYFFIQNVTIQLDNGETYEISPLSYVIANYNGNIEIYNYEKDEYIEIEGTYKNVMAESEEYKINMSIDAIEYGEKEQLLIKSVDKLNNLE